MTISRRHFLGASLALSAGIVAPGALAAPRPGASPASGTPPALLPQALAALDRHAGSITQTDLIGIADFSSHSRETRFHLVDVAAGRVRKSLLVAHGRGSDLINSGYVQRFSNRPGSNATSEGAFLTGEAYVGRHGRSRRLHGLEPQNDHAFARAIVIHGAAYVDMHMAQQQGRVGRSEGCFAFEKREMDELLRQLGPGRLLFASR
jgi:hypothetical protein